MRGFAVSAALVVGLVGCASEGGKPQSSDSPIINGTTNQGDPAVMALYGTSDGMNGGALCTATLISPTVLVTAAHCVSSAEYGANPRFIALRGTTITGASVVKLKVTSVDWDQAFNKDAPQDGHDIGLAILEAPVTDVTPVAWNRSAVTSADNGRPLRITGYGLDNGFEQLSGIFGGPAGSDSSAGTKRVAMTTQLSVDDLTVELGSSSFTGELTGDANICSGDSGGPVLANVDGVETIIAVNSYGNIGCLGSSHSTRVDKYAAFIQSHLN